MRSLSALPITETEDNEHYCFRCDHTTHAIAPRLRAFFDPLIHTPCAADGDDQSCKGTKAADVSLPTMGMVQLGISLF